LHFHRKPNGRPSRDAVALFMKDLDPSMYMRTRTTIPSEHGVPPKELSFAVVGNLSVSLDGISVNCGSMRFGHNSDGAWWVASKTCSYTENNDTSDLLGPDPTYYSLVCECDYGVMMEFGQQPNPKGSTSLLGHIDTKISDCTAILTKDARWVEVGSSPGGQSMTFSYGIERDYTVSHTKEWGSSTTTSASFGFSFGGFSSSFSISHTTSRDFSVEHSSTFSMSQEETYSTQLPAGTVWQFQMNIRDNCGNSGAHMKDFQVTNNSLSMPCCLPGYFADAKNPTGDCLTDKDGKNYNVCKNSSSVFAEPANTLLMV